MRLLVQTLFILIFLQYSHASQAVSFPECATDFMCYSMIKAKLSHSFDVSNVFDEKLDATNSAIMMIHAYSPKHYRVVLQSLNNDVVSIELKQKEKDEQIFSCSKEGDNAVFKANDKVKKGTGITDPLKCDVEFKSGSAIVADLNKPVKLVVTYGSSSKPPLYASRANLETPGRFFFCDPMRLKYKLNDITKKMAYKMVNMHLNDFHCNAKYDDGQFGSFDYLEYRKAGSSKYVKLNALTCEMKGEHENEKRKFVLNGVDEHEPDVDIDVRCVGEAKFFCDYDPKISSNGMKLNRTKGNKALGVPSRLECPNTHEFFVIKGRTPVPKKNSKFECLNYKGKMMWTFNDEILSENYPEVYCTNEKGCDRTHSSFLHDGAFLNEENLPMCHDGGQLWVNTNSESKCVEEDQEGTCIGNVEFSCDRSKGGLIYMKKGSAAQSAFVHGDHVFCDYPRTDVRQVNKKSANTIALIATGSGIVAACITSVIMFFFLRGIYRKQRAEFGKLKKVDLAEARKRRLVAFDHRDIDHEQTSQNSNRSTIKSGHGIGTSKSSIAERVKVSGKERRRGFFQKENQLPTRVIEMPPGRKDAIKRAYLFNTANFHRTDKLPAGYKIGYNERSIALMNRVYAKFNRTTDVKALRRKIMEDKQTALVSRQECLDKEKKKLLEAQEKKVVDENQKKLPDEKQKKLSDEQKEKTRTEKKKKTPEKKS